MRGAEVEIQSCAPFAIQGGSLEWPNAEYWGGPPTESRIPGYSDGHFSAGRFLDPRTLALDS